MKWPSAENHFVNGAEISKVFQFVGDAPSWELYRTVRLYVGVCLVTLEAIDICQS